MTGVSSPQEDRPCSPTGEPAVDDVRSAFELELSGHAERVADPEMLASIATLTSRLTGFQAVVLNVYRPADDDYWTPAVLGEPALRATLLESSNARASVERLWTEGRQPLPGVHRHRGFTAALTDLTNYAPDHPAGAGPDVWRVDDSLMMRLTADDGSPLACVSLDRPVSGRAPTFAQLRLVAAATAYAGRTLQVSQDPRSTRAEERMLIRLGQALAPLAASTGHDQLYRHLARTIVADLGFERVAIYHGSRRDRLGLVAQLGWERDPRLRAWLDLDRIAASMDPRTLSGGCWVTSSDRVFGPLSPGRRVSASAAPLHWSDELVVVPWPGANALVVAGDPAYRLVPRERQVNALRVLVDLAAVTDRELDPDA